MMKLNILSIVCMLLLFSTVSVYAVEDYALVADTQHIYMPGCDFQVRDLALINTGSQVIFPQIELVSRASDWITLQYTSQLLEPGASLPIQLLIAAPCKELGTYDLDFQITGVNEPKVIEQKITFQQAQNIDFLIENTQFLTCPCQQQVREFTLRNTGTFEETYQIHQTSHDEVYNIIPNAITLQPGDQIRGFIEVFSSCDVFGQKSTRIKIDAQNSGARAQLDLFTEIQACYDFSLDAPEQLQVCNNDVTFVQANITNDALIANAYTFDLKGEPSWIDLYGNYLENLVQSELGYTELQILPVGDRVGNYTFTLQATSSLGKLQAQKQIDVEVIECHGLRVNGPEQLHICEEVFTQPITINNTGITDRFINLSIDAPWFVHVEPGVIFVPANGSAQANVTIQATNITPGSNQAQILAHYQDNLLIRDAIDIAIDTHTNAACYEVEFSPTRIVVAENISQVAVNISHVGFRDAIYNLDLFGDQNVTLLQNNVSLFPGDQKELILQANTSGKHWVDISAAAYNVNYQQSIKFDNSGKTDYLFVIIIIGLILLILLILLLIFLAFRKSNKKDSKKDDKKNTSKKQKETQKQKGKKQVKETTKKAKKEKSKDKKGFAWWWILIIIIILLAIGLLIWAGKDWYDFTAGQNNQTSSNQTINQTTSQPDNQTTTDNQSQTNQTTCGVICQAQQWFTQLINTTRTNQSSTAQNDTTQSNITQNVTQSNQTQQQAVNDSQSTNTTEPVNTTEATTRQKIEQQIASEIQQANESNLLGTFRFQLWEENQEYTLNLSEYFVDPDNDTISFVYFPVRNITLEESDGVITFTPDKDFIGVRQTSFIAKDSSDGLVKSPTVTLVVQPTNQDQEGANDDLALTGILFIILIVVVIVYAITARKAKKIK